MISRREWLRLSVGSGAVLALDPRHLHARVMHLLQQQVITRAIPSTGERIPIIGLGSSATFSQVARSEDVSALKEVLKALVENGGTVFDTAPGYGASEEVAGRVAREAGITDRIFWATKVNVARGGGSADPAAARAQIDRSFERIGKRPIDLIQVHNLGDVATQIAILKQLKQEKRIRYIGVTSTDERQYPELISHMRNEPLDFIGVDYAIDNREVETTILPLARERKIGVLVYAPFGRTRLWRRVEGREVPAWATEFDAKTWAQFFLKFVASHPDVTAITPATSQPKNMIDNLGGGMGRLPNAEQRKRMIELVDALPPAQRRD
ncbi:MAG TPA: aldo/keto reductase [Gemmatimonadaceae bacterium]|jgi:aryl-alcohol dehydrogenase-like predicted oxidoreductase|nr:aldo/keto reductase [Gemmatimonadaceae bacterium]